MKAAIARGVGCVSAVALLGGCVSVPRDAGFGDVQTVVKDHVKQPIEWNRGAIEAQGHDERVQSLLQGPLDAERTVEIALRNNRDVQATLERLGIARAEYLQAFLPRNPILDVEIRFPASPVAPFEIAISQTLIDLVKLGSRKQLAAATLKSAQIGVSGAIVSFAAEVRSDFYDLQAAEQVLARQRVITQAARVSAEFSSRQHASGNISDLDLENEQALYEQAKLDAARTELQALAARERLTSDMGLAGPDIKWSVAEEFTPLPKTENPSEDLESVALSRRVDIAFARQELEAARRRLPLARTAVLDPLAVGIHQSREPDGVKTTGPSLALPIPIFDRGGASRDRAVGIARQAEQRLAALIITARSEVRAARERVLEARARTEYVRDVIVPRRRRILYLTQLEYNAMLKGVFQLIQARQNLAQAERDYVLAQRDYWLARTDLDGAISGAARFSARDEGSRAGRSSFSSRMTDQQSPAAMTQQQGK
ncbi:MAG: TolC family protein [Acidobacteriota bacterium]|nr:TolC family protein [Acidobacteriota bacterium]